MSYIVGTVITKKDCTIPCIIDLDTAKVYTKICPSSPETEKSICVGGVNFYPLGHSVIETNPIYKVTNVFKQLGNESRSKIIEIIEEYLQEAGLVIKDEKELAYYLLDMDPAYIDIIYEKLLCLWTTNNLSQQPSIIPKELEDFVGQIYGIYKTTFQD